MTYLNNVPSGSETCPTCRGNGLEDTGSIYLKPCSTCGGRGHIARRSGCIVTMLAIGFCAIAFMSVILLLIWN